MDTIQNTEAIYSASDEFKNSLRHMERESVHTLQGINNLKLHGVNLLTAIAAHGQIRSRGTLFQHIIPKTSFRVFRVAYLNAAV